MTAPASRKVLLLRGVNVGGRRVPMAELRAHLEARGLEDVRTYLQSGNVAATSELDDAALAELTQRTIAEEMGLEVPVLVRDRRQLDGVIETNPLGDVATEPKFHLVSFLSAPAPAEALARLATLCRDGERIEPNGREIYTWHPGGAGRSKLWAELSKLGTRRGETLTVTARNWSTVHALREML